MTEGIHYCKIAIPKRIQANAYIGATVEDSGGGNSFSLRWNRRGYNLPIIGWETTRANAWLIDKFIMSNRHTIGDAATFKNYYFIGYFGTNDHWLFINSANNQVSYCKGLVLNHSLVWSEENPLMMLFSGIFKSVW